jgi:3-oxoacyl-[acyl-carrier-protein] synthase III
MKLETVKLALPSRKLSNDDIILLIEEQSLKHYQGNLNKALENILFYLNYSGAQYRYWLDREETAIELLSKAINEALHETDYKKEDIDLLIYTGIGRGFIEPGGSYMTAYSLGMDKAHCFDILDACMSWSRAMYLVYNLFKTGAYKRAMIVNAEFNISAGQAVYPDVFKLQSLEQISWSFPAYTIGEAATATIISSNSDQEWDFHFSSRPDLADICTVPLEGYTSYCHTSEKIGRNGPGRFTSFGNELHTKGSADAVELFNKLKVSTKEIQAVFPHASSKKSWDDMGESAGVKHLLWHVYPSCGNLVSASVPAGIASATNEERIRRGDKLVGWVGSAGMSFCAYSFTY